MISAASYRSAAALGILFVCCLIVVIDVSAQQRKGYRLTNDRIVIDRASHWRNWELPVHAVDLETDGTVRPHFSRSQFNILDDLDTFTRPLAELKRRRKETAILNIDSTESLDSQGNVIVDRKKNPLYSYFVRPGISRVGSNPGAAANILDGDPTTFWEPDPNDPLENWWVEIDLARVVPVDELRLLFVDAELGDPFRQFRVLTAPDQHVVMQKADKVDFEVVGGTDAPNVTKRDFKIPLTQEKSDPNWTGKLVETIRIIVTDTKGAQGQLYHTLIQPDILIDADTWQGLPLAEQGEIIYFIKDQQGFEEPVSGEVYEGLPIDRRGRRELYKRERPRLSDIEIWGFGDNISPGMVEGGGSVFLTGGNFAPGPGFDGDFTSNFLHLVWSPTIDRGILTVDMGATFWLDAIRTSATAPRPYIDGYIVRGSDGSRDSSGRIKWKRFSPRYRENNSVERYEHLIDSFANPLKLRFLEFTVVSVDPKRRGGYNTGPNIAEYQIFSKGYPGEVEFTSDLIELPNSRNFGHITWEGETPPGTNMEIRTRSGNLLGKIVRFFDSSGTEIAEDAWNNLLGSFKGPADTTYVPIDGWSPWSRTYLEQGERITSPGLRRFMQVQVRLKTDNRNVAAAIRSIEMELLNPVAESLTAELWPTEVGQPGVVEEFDVFILPHFIENPVAARSSGFDELLLRMAASKQLELSEIGLDIDPSSGIPNRIFTLTADGEFVDDTGQSIQLLSRATGSDSIWIRLPEVQNILPQIDRTYNRIGLEGDQVPISQDGLLLIGESYGLLEPEEKGDIRYFSQQTGLDGEVKLSLIDQFTYADLPVNEQGPIRYFRILLGDGEQLPFDSEGDSLYIGAYNQLPRSERGLVVGPGALMKLSFKAPVFLNGTTLKLAVRNTDSGADVEAPWQDVESGDASRLVAGNTLSIQVPLTSAPLEDVEIFPNPFTPNGDGINEQVEISFSIFKITSSRQVTMRIFALNGLQIQQITSIVDSGKRSLYWNGRDAQGNLVPPGLYLCQLELDIDDEANAAIKTRLLSVVY